MKDEGGNFFCSSFILTARFVVNVILRKHLLRPPRSLRSLRSLRFPFCEIPNNASTLLHVLLEHWRLSVLNDDRKTPRSQRTRKRRRRGKSADVDG